MKTLKYFAMIFLASQLIVAQSIVIDEGASIYVGAGADVCAGEIGNITGNFYGEGTQCGQSIVTTFQLSVAVTNGWNMVSVPGLHPVDQNVNTWWQYREAGANVFRYSGGYQVVTEAALGIGYWMKHTGDRTYNTGDEWPAGGIQIVAHDPLNGASGWNLIGGYELSVTAANVTTNPQGLQSGPIYKYSNGYQVATTIDPGYGYWIKLNSAGQIIIPETLSKESKPVEWFPENWGKIVFIDAEDRSYILYCVKEEINLTNYELPPAPPAGMFDVRFESGKIAEQIENVVKPIEMSGVEYPITIRVENVDLRIQDQTRKSVNSILKSGESIVISNSTINKLNISKNEIPKEYALEQNYPNPFNPTTIIQYSIHQRSNVTLKVYDVLGRELATLVNEEKGRGVYSINFDASALASGIYLYRLQAGSFVEIKKMILLR